MRKYWGIGYLWGSAAFAANLEISFNRISTESYRDPYRNIERSGRNIEKDVIKLIQSAKQRVWVAAYELRLPEIAKALRAAHEKGLDVRLVTENTNNYELDKLDETITDASSYEEGRLIDYKAYVDLNSDGIIDEAELTQMDAIKIINEASIPMLDDTADGSKGSGLMHHKFIVIDSNVVFGGSGNFTWSDYHGDKLKVTSVGNANNFFLIENMAINKAFAEEFQIMWGDGPGGQFDSRFGVNKPYRAPLRTQLNEASSVTLQFGATSKDYGWEASPNGLIATRLKAIEESLEAALFVWSEQRLTDSIPRRIAGQLRILIEPFFGYRYYSELLDVLGVEMLGESCAIEKDNAPWPTPSLVSGISKLTTGDLIHHKFAVLDSKAVITGSQNWSGNANQNNDEVVLVLDSSHVAAQYKEEFQRLYANATLGLSPSLEYKINKEKERCGQTQ